MYDHAHSALLQSISETQIDGLSIKGSDSILDLGCGDGLMLAHLRDHSDGRYVGVDQSKEAIESARKEHEGINFICSDMDCDIGNFDWVISFFVMHLSPDHGVFFKLVKRNMSNTGRFFILSPTPFHPLASILSSGKKAREAVQDDFCRNVRSGIASNNLICKAVEFKKAVHNFDSQEALMFFLKSKLPNELDEADILSAYSEYRGSEFSSSSHSFPFSFYLAVITGGREHA